MRISGPEEFFYFVAVVAADGKFLPVDLDELAGVATKLRDYVGHVVETAKSVGRPFTEVEAKLGRLFARHAEEWRDLVSALPAGSWLRHVVSSGQGADYPWIKQS